MRIASSYPSPVLGVSKLKDRNRERGYATEQTNFRSDPTRKLTRRPSLEWKDVLYTVELNGEPLEVSSDIKTHSYIRDSKEYRLVFLFGGGVLGFVDGEPIDVIGDLEDYEHNGEIPWIVETIEGETFITNPNVITAMESDTDVNDYERVSHINITSALNYGETIQVNVITSDGTKHIVTYTIPDLGTSDPDYDTADKARATKQVALELAARINGGGVYETDVIPNPAYPDDPYSDPDWIKFCNPYKDDESGGAANNPDFDANNPTCKPYLTDYTGITGVTAVALGSTVAVWEDGRQDWITLEIEAGQGSRTATAINERVENVEGLPLFAVHGTRITVKPVPTSDKGTYYLEAERISSNPSGDFLEEVTWVQTRSPDGRHKINKNTMPRVCKYDGTRFVITKGDFDERKVGDDDSVKIPKFIDNSIQAIGYFQKRLVFVSGNEVIMSKTDEPTDFWRGSALQLLATDPVSISSSATNVDIIEQIIPYNRDLLLVASNSQFNIDGTRAVTPQTVSMTMTTAYECISSVKPVSIGNSIFFPIDYGDSVGIKEFTGERETDQDKADSITQHIIGYIEGGIKTMAANSNLNMLAVVPEADEENVIYIYEFKRNFKGDLLQHAWSKWVLPDDSRIVDVEFIRDKMTVITADGNRLVVKDIEMYGSNNYAVGDIFLDNRLVIDTTGADVTLPEDYNDEDVVVIGGDGTDLELNNVEFTKVDRTLTFKEDIGEGKVIVGRPFVSTYEPTRPFRYEEDGSVVTNDRLRVNRYTLSVVDTNEVSMKIQSEYYDYDDQTFNSRITGSLNNLIGSVPLHTGDVNFAFNQDAGLATASFYCDNWLGCNIVDISWEGQYHQSSGRM